MAEESGDHETSTGPPSPSGTPSPRCTLGCGNIGTKDNSICCAIASSGTGNPSPISSAVVNESTITTTANVGVVAIASVTATAVPSVVSLLTWTSVPETGAAAAMLAPGGGGISVPATLGGSGAGSTKISGNSSPRSPKLPRKSRVKLSDLQLESATREEWAAKWREQDLYVECLEAQAAAQEGELVCLRDSEEKYRQQCFEVSHRERVLARRLASKEQQLLGYINQITELRAGHSSSASAIRSTLLDPAVNILIQKLRQELLNTKAKLEDTQNELSAWKFTPDSNTGKRLMAKCRLLYQENEELGRMIASGRIAKLEGELVLQKNFSEEVKKSQSELDEFLQDLDEDVEGMQSTIYFLQQELRKARESVSLLQQENNAFKSMSSLAASPLVALPQLHPQSPPPQPSIENNGLSNGVAPLSYTALVPKVEPTNDRNDDYGELDIGSSGDAKLVDPVKIEINVDGDGDSCIEYGDARTSLLVGTTATSTSTLLTSNKTRSDCHELEPERCRLDEPDESSNDSAALIIKVENEELSEREEDEDEAATSETREPQEQSTRTIRDRTTIKSDGIVDNQSNGDDRSFSRSSSRRHRGGERTAKRDKSAADSDNERRSHKKKRRESILSLDYTETDDDALLLTNGESIQSDPEDKP